MVGAAKFSIAFTLFGQGDTPSGKIFLQSTLFAFLIWHLLGWNLIPILVAFWAVSKRRISCFSLVDP